MDGSRFSCEEACRYLGVTPETLYAYVSRGLIRSEATPGSRRRRYVGEDLEGLRQRRELRRRPQEATRASLDWGTPILDSALTSIRDGVLRYRGRDVLELAEAANFARSVSWVWGRDAELPEAQRIGSPGGRGDSLSRFQAWLPGAGEDLLVQGPKAAGRWHAAGVELLLTLASLIARRKVGRLEEIGPGLAGGWAGGGRGRARLIEQALILCIDHELNISSFTARCVASAGAGPSGVVNGALSAMRGVRHGGATERVEALFEEMAAPRGTRARLGRRLQRGDALSGFGHRLYPGGDPRARFLLEVLQASCAKEPSVRLAGRIVDAAVDLTGQRPNIDFALVTLRRALGAPRGAALEIFVLGRLAGWIAHAVEQRESGRLIRPRARYTGP